MRDDAVGRGRGAAVTAPLTGVTVLALEQAISSEAPLELEPATIVLP